MANRQINIKIAYNLSCMYTVKTNHDNIKFNQLFNNERQLHNNSSQPSYCSLYLAVSMYSHIPTNILCSNLFLLKTHVT